MTFVFIYAKLNSSQGGGQILIYVIDTSALLRDPCLLDKLNNSEIIIHTIVINELDRVSKRNNTRGSHARNIGDRLFSLRNRGDSDFLKGIKVKSNVIYFDDTKPKPEIYSRFGFDTKSQDNLLLCVAKEIKDRRKEEVTLITGDKFFTLKSMLDINVQYIDQNKVVSDRKKKRKHNVTNRNI